MARETKPDPTKRIRVVRNFIWQGEIAYVGDELEVPEVFAIEMIAVNKAEAIDPEPEPGPSQQDRANAPYGGHASSRFKRGGEPPAPPAPAPVSTSVPATGSETGAASGSPNVTGKGKSSAKPDKAISA